MGSLVLPNGNTSNRNGTYPGAMRYNTQINEVEVYQGSNWRSLRFKESTSIIQQNLGAGDNATIYFGPLNSAYNPTNISSDVPNTGAGSYGGQNIIVVVENTIQLSSINYTVEQNPSITHETYYPQSSTDTSAGSSTVYFNTSISAGLLEITGATAVGSIVTVTYAAQAAAPFAVGSTIVVTDFRPLDYNGTYTVTSCDTTTLVYTANTSPATDATVLGTVATNLAVYPAVNIAGATVSGSANIQPGTTVLSYSIDPYTDALTSIVLNQPTITGTITADTQFVITAADQTGSGYYLRFSSPVPYGKTVTALIGFDQ
jgi:hypothetical protein